jgi:branched-chain amino acid aminotransferase
MSDHGRIWLDGELVAHERATVHVLTHGLHYGTGVFDSLRAYATADGPALFRAAEHTARLFASAELLRMPIPFEREEIRSALRAVVADSGLDACYVRPIVFRGEGPLGVSPRGCPVRVAIAAWPWGAYLGDEAAERGIRVTISSWQRLDGRTHLPAAKACAHYLNGVLARLDAEEAGYDEALLLDDRGELSEGSGENLFVVEGGTLVTPPPTSSALGGITRASILELARDAGIPAVERPITRSQLFLADEVFLTGTAAELTPVREIDGREVGGPGPLTRRLQALFADAAHGRLDAYRHWIDLVAGRPGVPAATA